MPMTEKQIFILTGAKHSGKTTSLMKCFFNYKNAFGIFSPVIEGTRGFMDANTREIFPMEANAREENVLSVGKYIFSAAAFARAISILENALQQNPSWIIIDEIGKLELDQKGFHDVIQKILEHQNQKTKILFVIRDTVLNDTINFFNLDKFTNIKIISIAELQNTIHHL